MTFKNSSSPMNPSNWDNTNDRGSISSETQLHIQTASTVVHSHGNPSQEMTNDLKVSPLSLFKEVLANKGELVNLSSKWIDHKTLSVEGISNLTLHSYILEAEKRGKKIELIKTTTIKISN